MSHLEILLGIITPLLGLGNIAQWVNIRALRDKAKYEAENAHIESLKRIIELQAAEIKRLQDRQKELEDRISNLEKNGNN